MSYFKFFIIFSGMVFANIFKASVSGTSNISAERRILRDYFLKKIQAETEEQPFENSNESAPNDVSALYVVQKMLRPRTYDVTDLGVVPNKRAFNVQGSLLK
ncbi:uncharacterized protein LOC133188993 [Saccostrea echinata]|uniref:uncharacterized protein LOC133188993 n=1 Tax=Saccostrea echinata TaxID=191078 RepID=UPI002A7F6008|nr:uncharacterized protein LOC133188993 [Saccostrea echinata]